MPTFSRVPIVPGPVLEIYVGAELFPMHPDLADTWHPAPDGTVQGMIFDGANYASAPGPSVNDILKSKILGLESQQTERRIREAINGTDGGWMKNLEDQIAALRSQLTK